MKDLFSVKEKNCCYNRWLKWNWCNDSQWVYSKWCKNIHHIKKIRSFGRTAKKSIFLWRMHLSIQSDLSNSDGINQFYSEIQNREEKIDVLINNAGTAWASSFDEFPEKGWDKVMDINLKSVFFLTQKFLPLLKKSGSKNDPARVINIASINGLTHPLMPTYSYSSSKSALIHLTRHLGADLAKYNININAIAPGFFPSKMTSHIAENESLSAQVIDGIPIKRMGST